ncbi:MAG: 3'-5' exonuclease [Gammaproteobacteria bacterium]|nr:MAG: 3'-5' exonuclease [Gammaproteobacteria bacterium]
MSATLIFDIETIPDIETGKRLNPELAKLSDKDAQKALVAMRQEEAGSDFMRLPLHKIACISFLWVEDNQFTLKTLSLNDMNEAQVLTTFFRAFNKQPTLVSWNGTGFDVPVLLYRAMLHKLSAPALFNTKQRPDYLYRYGDMHIDLMDKLSMFNGYNRQTLDVVASLCGFAGKQDVNGSMVVDLVKANKWDSLHTYCESDVLNTWLIYLRWQLLIGNIDNEQMTDLEQSTKDYLSTHTDHNGNITHQNFLDAWA